VGTFIYLTLENHGEVAVKSHPIRHLPKIIHVLDAIAPGATDTPPERVQVPRDGRAVQPHTTMLLPHLKPVLVLLHARSWGDAHLSCSGRCILWKRGIVVMLQVSGVVRGTTGVEGGARCARNTTIYRAIARYGRRREIHDLSWTQEKHGMMQMAKPNASGAIGRPYLLVIKIPIYVDDHGVRWADPLWHRDLLRHLDYLNDFFLACPHIAGPPPAGWLSLEGYRISYVPIPRQLGRFRSVLTGPSTFLALWRAIQHVDVVHAGVGGWYPWSTSNIATVISILLKRFRITIVESAAWRLIPGEPASVGRRIDSLLSEWANRMSVSLADLSIYTHAEYKRSLLRRNSTRGHVIHASWINENDILSDAQGRECWSRKRESGLVRFLFAGRLSPSKGVRQLLQAVKLLQDHGSAVFLDIMGSGELEDECRAFLATSVDSNSIVRMVAPIQYGPEFFDCLRSYSAVLVPSLGDEQPRIVYDALAVAVPPLASSTVGIADCVEHGVTGRLFQPRNAAEVANAMKWAISNPASLETMGMSGLERARSMTHAAMHQRRLALLLKELH